VRRALWAIAFILLIAAVAIAQVRSAAVAREALVLHRKAGETSRPWSDRLSEARAAARLRPDVIAYRQRAASIHAARLTEVGALDKARLILIEAWGADRTNVQLRAQLQEVNRLITARDSRKAHILHGREKPGGVLEPGDLMP